MKNILFGEIALNYILAGKSLVTFENKETGNRFTYRIQRSKSNEKILFVGVLVSPDRYKYIGYIFNKEFKWSRNSKIEKNATSVKVFSWVLDKLKNNKLPEVILIWHWGKCGSCGRILTTPDSIKNGIGPFCMKKIKNLNR